MITSRRRFILLSALIALWGFVGRALGKKAPGYLIDANLRAWLEVLIPPDSISPGAGGLRVDADLMAVAKETPRRYKLLQAGVRWADSEAKAYGSVYFSALAAEQANEVVAKAAASEIGTVPRAFFEYTLRETKKIYYAKPEAWVGLGIERPPQPIGYVDYMEVMK